MMLTLTLTAIMLGIITVYAIYPHIGLIIHDAIAQWWYKNIMRK